MRTLRTRAAALAVLLTLAAPAPAAQAPRANPLHPPIPLRDAQGAPIAARAQDVDTDRSCGGCHDTAFIRAHDAHARRGETIDCLSCHLPGGKAAALALPRDADSSVRLPMAPPGSASCGQCHGLVHTGEAYLELPDSLRRGTQPGALAQTLRTGEIFSDQALAGSLLNLQGKAALDRPWDLHAARGLQCVSCHFAANNPKMALVAKRELEHLREDPRSLTIAEYLEQPDHLLRAAACRDCHDPRTTHAALPYAERHLAALACQTCHTPQLYAPALRAEDRTVLTAEDAPRLEFRGVAAADFTAPSTWYLAGQEPLLARVTGENGSAFAPFNLIARWEWVDGTGRPVPVATLRRSLKDEAGNYHPELLAALDADHDGRLADGELRLAGEAEDWVRRRLLALGVAAPRIAGSLEAYPVVHGTVRGEWALANCEACHVAQSRFNAELPLASTPLPGGVLPVPSAATAPLLAGRRLDLRRDALVVVGSGAAADSYVFGQGGRTWSDRVGLALFALTVLGVAVHGLLRYRLAGRRPRIPQPAGRREYMYGLYERIWHWTMAGSIVFLLASGLAIHWPQRFPWLGFPVAVLVHNTMAWVLILNSGLSLFYHLSTGEIRQFLPQPAGLRRRLIAQGLYYLRGIFAGAAHPTQKSPERKLNPLQQVTYAGLLNLLFPLQVVTGVLLWIGGLAPERLGPALGLSFIAPLHNLVAWLFLAFLVMHVYLTTTGRSVTANLKAMASGWETVDDHAPAPAPTPVGALSEVDG